LSVPSAWASAAPPQMISSPTLLNAHTAAAIHPDANGLLRGIPMVGTGAGRRAAGGFTHHYGFRHAVIPRPPAGG
jgi:PPE-SVP subfamily C-terminal region